MIAADTSSFSNFMSGEPSADARMVEKAIEDESLLLPPMVITELLSSPRITNDWREVILDFPTLELRPGFWARTGDNRSMILRTGKKARTLDCMIATTCLDHDIPIIARDEDFRHFVDHLGLVVKSGTDG
ncbi:MAG: PIN domain-containing protein [Verrucomicrobiota bacterium]